MPCSLGRPWPCLSQEATVRPLRTGGLENEKAPRKQGFWRNEADAERSNRDALVGVGRLAQHIAPAPDGLDIVLALAGVGEFFAQLADEHVDDLEFRLIHAAIEVVQKHLLGERRAFAQGE